MTGASFETGNFDKPLWKFIIPPIVVGIKIRPTGFIFAPWVGRSIRLIGLPIPAVAARCMSLTMSTVGIWSCSISMCSRGWNTPAWILRIWRKWLRMSLHQGDNIRFNFSKMYKISSMEPLFSSMGTKGAVIWPSMWILHSVRVSGPHHSVNPLWINNWKVEMPRVW